MLKVSFSMKLSIVIALNIACVAVFSAKPKDVQVSDWTSIEDTIGEIEVLIRDFIDEIRKTTIIDNEKVAAELNILVDSVTDKLIVVYEKVMNNVSDHTFNEQQVKEASTEVKDILRQFRKDASSHFSNLSDSAVANISRLFYNTFVTIERKAEQLCAFLRV